MAFVDDIAEFGSLIDEYDRVQPAWHVVTERRGVEWPPREMRVRVLETPDWVECRVLPSSLTIGDVDALEAEFGVDLPPPFRAYLLARFHLHDQLRAPRHQDHQVFWLSVPSENPLGPLRQKFGHWSPLFAAGYVPFAEWGDGYGPMCFDTAQRSTDGDCPVVWMDHELLAPLGPDRCRERSTIEPLARPLYPTSRELIRDVFMRPTRRSDDAFPGPNA